jgi:hypothetical protein
MEQLPFLHLHLPRLPLLLKPQPQLKITKMMQLLIKATLPLLQLHHRPLMQLLRLNARAVPSVVAGSNRAGSRFVEVNNRAVADDNNSEDKQE